MQPSPRFDTPVAREDSADRYSIAETIPFVLAHIVCVAAIFTGVRLTDLLIAVGLYAIRMFGITAGYHRYFSHRSFKTSRLFGFLLAFVAQSSAQRGVLWWAGTHRHHHRFSDTENDVHSPVRRSFWYSHLGWFFTDKHGPTDLTAIPDFAIFPELRWLDRNPYVPPVLLAVLVLFTAGWSGLVVGFFWSTVALWHATFSINSIAHLVGRRRYVTGDESRNNWWLALLTFGEGWHNNHHHYQSAARQGFRWFEIDFSYYVLRALSAVGLVWDLHTPPPPVVRSEQRLRRAVVERAANQLAASFQVDSVAADLRAVLAEKRASLDASIHELHDNLTALIDLYQDQFDKKAETIRDELDQIIRTAHLPEMPTVADLRNRATAMFVRTVSLNDIVERARQILIDDVFEELLARRTELAAAKA